GDGTAARGHRRRPHDRPVATGTSFPPPNHGGVFMDTDITGMEKTYRGGVTALAGVTRSIPTGMFGLLGASPGGKPTLMPTLAGVLPATAGTVRIGEHDLAARDGRTAVKRTLGYLPQERGVYPDLSAAEFLHYVALLKDIEGRAQRRAKVAE